MRVLVVTTWFPSAADPGMGVFNQRDVELLANAHTVTVIHLHPPGLSPTPEPWNMSDGTNVIPVPFSTGVPRTLQSVRSILAYEASNHDLLHSMAFSSLLPVWISRLTSRAVRSVPWVHTEHWSALLTKAPTLRSKVGGAVLKPLLGVPDEVIAVGTNLATIIDAHRRNKRPSTIIPNFVRFPDSPVLPQDPSLRGSQPLKLVAVGGMIPRKGTLETIHTVAELQQRGVQTHLTWVGTGELQEPAKRLATALEIHDRVTFTGHIPPEQLSATLQEHHLFLLPTDAETFGVAFAEALAVGLPVVTSGMGGHLDFLPQGGFRWADKTPIALANAVLTLVDDPARWSAEKIVAYAQATFSEKTRQTQYQEVYARVFP